MKLNLVLSLLCASMLSVACGQVNADGNFAGGGTGGSSGGVGGATGTGGDTGTGGSAGTSAYTGLPCDVAQVLASKCGSCHGPGGTQAPPLVTRDNLLAASGAGTIADRVLARMQDAASPMPPSYAGAPASAAEIAAVQAWVNGGSVAGTCSTAVDAGTVSTTPTCASGSYAGGGTGRNMAPGKACIQCHNHGFRYMGTAFPALHEKDNCKDSPPGTVTVEIMDVNDVVRVSMNANSVGNFMGSGVTSPYKAQVKLNGAVIAKMTTPQTNGDCNVCHTVAGAQGAPGRITY